MVVLFELTVENPGGAKSLLKYRSRIRIRRPRWTELEVRRIINITWERAG